MHSERPVAFCCIEQIVFGLVKLDDSVPRSGEVDELFLSRILRGRIAKRKE
jgi:hypothetical protein